MAIHANSTPAPSRRLLRAAGPCAVLETAEVLALMADVPALPFLFVLRPAPPADVSRRQTEGHISDAR